MNYQPRSTNPYIMEKKLNKCVGGGGLDPSVLEEIEAEISVLGSENATMAQDIIDIKGSLNSINDNLSGFKFYPTGTNLVALISNDSFYTDSDDKYVLWGTATANQLVTDNPGVYKSLASTEDCRGEVGADTASPFSSPFSSKISLTILGSGSGSDSYRAGVLDVDNTHNYSKLKVIEYIRIENAQNNNYPRFTIGTTSYSRPAVGTVLDISQQSVKIECNSKANMSDWNNYGVKVELS